MIGRVLIALDDSSRAPTVLAKGVDIARAAGASVLIYHAVAIPPEFPPAAATHGGDPLPAHLHRVATERLQALAIGIHDVPCKVLVEEAQRAWRAIIDAASKFNADVIVIGSHRQRARCGIAVASASPKSFVTYAWARLRLRHGRF